ncbi:MAG TPA: YdeI/OmpD-associated family protein [Jatrophihabitantaceae bacterium]|jgi:uncharacterized protein YdeI (YjbR/CyaY-like superfamily)
MADEVHLDNRAAWRNWLSRHHADRAEIWLVSWKTGTGKPSIPYAAAVEEAICFGWIDGAVGTVDDDRSKRRFAHRLPGSAWSAANRERAERLASAGFMARAGLEAVARAKADGSWTALDEVEAMTLPDDLAAALDAKPGARATFDSFAPYLRRDILTWIAAAKQRDTRARRMDKTAREAADGRVVPHTRASRTAPG